jgi:hypothetical protein
MRLNALSPAVAASRPSETQSLVATKPALESKPAAELKCLPGHGIVDGGCFPQLPVKPGADAQTRATQGNQLHTIADGVRNGSLTEQEAQKLLTEQQAIADAQKAAMADGKLTMGERLKLGLMQHRADQNIQKATHNNERDVFAFFDKDAQRQAGQIDQIANGRTNGNITNFEAGKLLGQQAKIAGARDNHGPFGGLLTDMQQDKAAKDIARHSKPGTQLDFEIKPLPFYMKGGLSA